MQKGKEFQTLLSLMETVMTQSLSEAWGPMVTSPPRTAYQCSPKIKESCGGIMQASDVLGLGLWTAAPCLSDWPVPVANPYTRGLLLAQGVEGLDLANWDFGKGLLST